MSDAFAPPDLPPPDTGELADRGTRLLAFSVDAALSAVVGGLAAALVTVGAAAFGLADASAGPAVMAYLLAQLPLWALQWWWTARDGQTLGKRWLDVRIVLDDGGPPGFLRGVVVRGWVFSLLPQLCGLVTLLDLLLIFAADRRTLHDRAAGTRVVRC